jgi:hypothetical protein
VDGGIKGGDTLEGELLSCGHDGIGDKERNVSELIQWVHPQRPWQSLLCNTLLAVVMIAEAAEAQLKCQADLMFSYSMPAVTTRATLPVSSMRFAALAASPVSGALHWNVICMHSSIGMPAGGNEANQVLFADGQPSKETQAL